MDGDQIKLGRRASEDGRTAREIPGVTRSNLSLTVVR